MRRSTRVWVISASVVFLWSCGQSEEKAAAPAAGEAAAPAAASAMGPGGRPVRKAGLWEHTLETSGMKQVQLLCLDAETDRNFALLGQSMDAESGCSKNSYTPVAGGYAFESVCPDGQGGTTTSKGSLTGDFSSRYTLKANIVTTGSSMPQANQPMSMSMTGVWKGPCPADMKPGDVRISMPGMPNGVQMNLQAK